MKREFCVLFDIGDGQLHMKTYRDTEGKEESAPIPLHLRFPEQREAAVQRLEEDKWEAVPVPSWWQNGPYFAQGFQRSVD